MKIKIFIIIILLTPAKFYAQQFEVAFLPEEKKYKSYYADALAHQFSLSKHLETSEWFGNIGNVLTLADITFLDIPFQVSGAATIFNTIIKTPGHIQVYTVDYLVDFYADIPLSESLTGRFQLGHLSAHYSDDGITELGFYPLNYVRDYAAVHAQYLINIISGKVYTGIFYNFHNEPLPAELTIQFGADAEKRITKLFSFYAALDIKAKSEVNYGTTQSIQTGIKFYGSGSYALRIAYTHRRGFEERGQLFAQKDIKNSLGFYFDF
jgi:hypothetical protein